MRLRRLPRNRCWETSDFRGIPLPRWWKKLPRKQISDVIAHSRRCFATKAPQHAFDTWKCFRNGFDCLVIACDSHRQVEINYFKCLRLLRCFAECSSCRWLMVSCVATTQSQQASAADRLTFPPISSSVHLKTFKNFWNSRIRFPIHYDVTINHPRRRKTIQNPIFAWIRSSCASPFDCAHFMLSNRLYLRRN